MSLPLKSFQDFYDLCIQTLETDSQGDLTDTNDGSIIDAFAGLVSTIAVEVQTILVDRFNKTFIELAEGPETTGGPDDLQTLATDHFGDSFARPGAVKAIDTVTFTRPGGSPATYGAVTILSGSIVKTRPDANGNTQRYVTDSDVTLTNSSSGSDTNVSVGVTAVVAGSAGSAAAATINTIETALLDPTILVTNTGNSTGEDAQDTSTYRETIRNLIKALAGATKQAIEAKAKTVSGVVTATGIEQAITAIQYDPATALTSGTYFRVAKPVLYIADATGTASGALVQAVTAAIQGARSCGILIRVLPATAVTVNWTSTITLNPSGPSYATFVNNPQLIKDSMTDYINNLAVGTGFVRATANAAMLALWGPAGTNDITAFSTSIPSGDVAATASQKMVAGTVALV